VLKLIKKTPFFVFARNLENRIETKYAPYFYNVHLKQNYVAFKKHNNKSPGFLVEKTAYM